MKTSADKAAPPVFSDLRAKVTLHLFLTLLLVMNLIHLVGGVVLQRAANLHVQQLETIAEEQQAWGKLEESIQMWRGYAGQERNRWENALTEVALICGIWILLFKLLKPSATDAPASSASVPG
jgi:hypothetical protein